jgi:hypothetical protein
MVTIKFSRSNSLCHSIFLNLASNCWQYFYIFIWTNCIKLHLISFGDSKGAMWHSGIVGSLKDFCDFTNTGTTWWECEDNLTPIFTLTHFHLITTTKMSKCRLPSLWLSVHQAFNYLLNHIIVYDYQYIMHSIISWITS